MKFLIIEILIEKFISQNHTVFQNQRKATTEKKIMAFKDGF
jgi:hypothetical protein